MTTLNSRLQLALLNRKKGRNLLEKGFTLVELMIVIVIVGILSSVALPNFLSQTEKAKATEAKTKISSYLKQGHAEWQEDGSVTDTSSQANFDADGSFWYWSVLVPGTDGEPGDPGNDCSGTDPGDNCVPTEPIEATDSIPDTYWVGAVAKTESNCTDADKCIDIDDSLNGKQMVSCVDLNTGVSEMTKKLLIASATSDPNVSCGTTTPSIPTEEATIPSV